MQTRGMATNAEVEQARKTRIVFQAAPAPPANLVPAFSALMLTQLENHFNRARLELGGMQVLTTLTLTCKCGRHAPCKQSWPV